MAILLVAAARSTLAQPVAEVWPVEGPDQTVACAAAPLAGWYAVADSHEDNIEIRDVNRTLVHVITRSDIELLLPGFALTGGPDGPCGLAWSDSGRSLFILVYEELDTPQDAILRYDTFTHQLSIFDRLNLWNNGGVDPFLGAAFFRGRLYVGTAQGDIRVYRAEHNDLSGVLLNTLSIPAPHGVFVHGLAVDRSTGQLFAATEAGLFLADLNQPNPTLSLRAALTGIQSLAFSDSYGHGAGLYILMNDRSLRYSTPAQAEGSEPFASSLYWTCPQTAYAVASSACGHLLVGTDEDAVWLSDASDARRTYATWLDHEFSQHVQFATSLILPDDAAVPNCSPDGLPPFFVVDADVQLGWCRFHPCTPDSAALTVLLLLMDARVHGNSSAETLAAGILTRYAGLSADGIVPAICAEGGASLHWIDPTTGCVPPNWPEDYGTLSTMYLAVAASRAMQYYPANPVIRRAGQRILIRCVNLDQYIQNGSDALALLCFPESAGNPCLFVPPAQPCPPPVPPAPACPVNPFFEALSVIEIAATYSGPTAATALTHWLDRGVLPSAEYIVGMPVTGNVPNHFQPAFVSHYPNLFSVPFRQSSAWQTHMSNLLASFAAWTDDNSPRFFTVFSAGTTRDDWSASGYHADSLTDHPGDITTIPSLLAFCAAGRTAEAVAAYHAYRLGAAQTFAGGTELLYRRSNADPSYQPNSAGLPDVALGGLGLAELLSPGAVDAVLARPYPPFGDIDLNGTVDAADLAAFVAILLSPNPTSAAAYSADLNADGVVDGTDIAHFVHALLRS